MFLNLLKALIAKYNRVDKNNMYSFLYTSEP